MYRQLQKKVKDHIVASLCQISDNWNFDIDTNDKDKPIIVGYGPDDLVIETPIEELCKYMTQELNNGIRELYSVHDSDVTSWVECLLIKQFVSIAFQIYGLNMWCSYEVRFMRFVIFGKNSGRGINSWVYMNHSSSGLRFVSPFMDSHFERYVMKEPLISPFLLLLNPIEYFRRYSIVIQKYQVLDMGHTLGIYELLIEYFPEMNKELWDKYLVLFSLLGDVCYDIVAIIGEILAGLYMQKK